MIHVIGALSIPVLAGCLSNNSRTPTVLLVNQTTSPITVQLTITNVASDAEVYSESVSVDYDEELANRVTTIEGVIEEPGEHLISVELKDDNSDEYVWDVPGNQGQPDGAVGLDITVYEDRIEFTETAA